MGVLSTALGLLALLAPSSASALGLQAPSSASALGLRAPSSASALGLQAPGGAAQEMKEEKKVVHVVAERFSFVPSQVKVKQGNLVEFRLRSQDTNHGFRISEAGINVVIPKRGRGETTVQFRAVNKGQFTFECSKPCGAGHNMMRGVVIVE